MHMFTSKAYTPKLAYERDTHWVGFNLVPHVSTTLPIDMPTQPLTPCQMNVDQANSCWDLKHPTLSSAASRSQVAEPPTIVNRGFRACASCVAW